MSILIIMTKQYINQWISLTEAVTYFSDFFKFDVSFQDFLKLGCASVFLRESGKHSYIYPDENNSQKSLNIKFALCAPQTESSSKLFAARSMKSPARDDADYEELPELKNPDPDNIDIYLNYKGTVTENVIEKFEETEPTIGEMSVYGYVRLYHSYIKDLINTKHTIVHRFNLPSQKEIKEKEFFSFIDRTEGIDCNRVYICKVSGKGLQVSGYDDLYIHLSDFLRLKDRCESYRPIVTQKIGYEYTVEVPLNTIGESKSESSDKAWPKKRERKKALTIINYRHSAAGCLAFLLWRNYPNITPAKLREYWVFKVIHCYRFKDCKNDQGKIDHAKFNHPLKISPDYIHKAFEQQRNCSLDTIQRWIKFAKPLHIISKTGNPSQRKKISDDEFKLMTEEIDSSAINEILKRLIISIEYYDSSVDRKYHDQDPNFRYRINLHSIIDEIDAGGDELQSEGFWKNKLGVEIFGQKLGYKHQISDIYQKK